jgi:hypothetical protein
LLPSHTAYIPQHFVPSLEERVLGGNKLFLIETLKKNGIVASKEFREKSSGV